PTSDSTSIICDCTPVLISLLFCLFVFVFASGLLDDDGLPHGFCTVTYSSTDRFEGNFVHGEKNGRGKFFFFDGSTLEGYYVDDALQGQGLYTYEDGGVLHGTHVDGELNGPAQEYDIDGRLIFKGQYKDNIRHGMCWIYYPNSAVSSGKFISNSLASIVRMEYRMKSDL
uniref:Histone-lysine N-methyltransferase SETD7 n=1 Tax=Terrapene triunguis TaxID=2587831 RepID=A0A674JAZ2_9SAUR